MAPTATMMRSNKASAIGISIEFQPSPVILVAELAAISDELEDFTEPLTDSIKKVMMPSIRANFKAQGRPSWAPLSAATLNRRKYDGRGVTGRILSRTTRLLRRATAFKIWTVNGKAGEAFVASLGGDVWYGNIHQMGFEGSGEGIGRIIRGGVPQIPSATLRPGDEIVEGYAGDIPARPFILIQPEDAADIEQVFEDWVGNSFRKHGWGGR